MTLNSEEIIWWNTIVTSLLLLAASAVAFSSAVTNIAVNQQKNIIQQWLEEAIKHTYDLFFQYRQNLYSINNQFYSYAAMVIQELHLVVGCLRWWRCHQILSLTYFEFDMHFTDGSQTVTICGDYLLVGG